MQTVTDGYIYDYYRYLASNKYKIDFSVVGAPKAQTLSHKDKKVEVQENPEENKKGKKKKSRAINKPCSRMVREAFVGTVWKHVVTNMLHWTPKEALEYMTLDVAAQFKLDKIFDYLLYCDLARTFRSDVYVNTVYCLQLAFPGEIKFDDRLYTIEMFKKIFTHNQMSNIAANTDRKTATEKWPKGFFTTAGLGQKRVEYIMQYLYNELLHDLPIKEVYEFFSDEDKGRKWLDRPYGLYQYTVRNFAYRDTLHLIHDTLPYDKKDDFWYYKYVLDKKVNEFLKAKKQASEPGETTE